MGRTDAWGMERSTEDIKPSEQTCQKNLFLDNFAIMFVEKC